MGCTKSKSGPTNGAVENQKKIPEHNEESEYKAENTYEQEKNIMQIKRAGESMKSGFGTTSASGTTHASTGGDNFNKHPFLQSHGSQVPEVARPLKTDNLTLNVNTECEVPQGKPIYRTDPRHSPLSPRSIDRRQSNGLPSTLSVNIVNSMAGPFSYGDKLLDSLTKEVEPLRNPEYWKNQEAWLLFNVFLEKFQSLRIDPRFGFYLLNSLKALNTNEKHNLSLYFYGLAEAEGSSSGQRFETPEMMTVSAFVLNSGCLDALSITNAKFSFASCAEFGNALAHNNSIINLELTSCKLDDSMIATLARGFITGNIPLLRINLRENRFGDSGLLSICRFLLAENTKVTYIDVSQNKFSISAAASILHFIQAYSKLESFNLVNIYSHVENNQMRQVVEQIEDSLSNSRRRNGLLFNVLRPEERPNKLFTNMMKLLTAQKYNKDLTSWIDAKAMLKPGSQMRRYRSSIIDGPPEPTSEENPKRRSSSAGFWPTPKLFKGFKRLSWKARHRPRTKKSESQNKPEAFSESHSFGFYQLKGLRKQMQDFVLSVLNFRGNTNESLFGIFDGHGGVMTAKFTRAVYAAVLESELGKISSKSATAETTDESDEDKAMTGLIEKALHKSFAVMQSLLERYAIPYGTCALIVYMRNDTLHVANVGDSQGLRFICSNENLQKIAGSDSEEVLSMPAKPPREHWEIQDAQSIVEAKEAQHFDFDVLSRIIRPTDEEEVLRIENHGGYVIRNRVDGTLAVSRALGDIEYQPRVTYEPTMQLTKVFPNGTIEGVSVVILASDGLWGVVPENEVVQIALQEIALRTRYCASETLSPREIFRHSWNISKRLCDEAISRGSSDNISVICILIRQ